MSGITLTNLGLAMEQIQIAKHLIRITIKNDLPEDEFKSEKVKILQEQVDVLSKVQDVIDTADKPVTLEELEEVIKNETI